MIFFQEKFEIETKFKEYEIWDILYGLMDNTSLLFPDKIMTGYLHHSGNMHGQINPPGVISDPFKSTFTGKLNKHSGKNVLIVNVTMSYIVIGLCLIWLLPITLVGAKGFNLEILESVGIIKLILGSLFWFSIPFLFGKLKLNWDKRRLKEEMVRNLSTKK